MIVNTYEVEQSSSEATTLAQDGAALELIEKLGLEGQKQILEPNTATRNPYRAMTKRELTVFGSLLSNHVALEKYNVDTIPLRVLQVAAHAKECGLFETLEVWYADPAVLRDDPVLIGRVRKSSYETIVHILARWGDALPSLEDLEQIAFKALRPERLENLRTILREVEAQLREAEVTQDLALLASKASFYK